MNSYIDAIRRRFEARIDKDDFHDLRIEDSPQSIHEFVDLFTAGDAVMRNLGLSEFTRFPELTDLTITFAEFLRLKVTIHHRTIPVETWFNEKFCHSIVCALGFNMITESQPGEYFKDLDFELRHAFVKTFNESPASVELAVELGGIVAKKFGEKPLLSFYIRKPPLGSFAMWGPRALSGEGKKLPTKVISEAGYSVTVSVSRYEEVDGPISALEWSATLTIEGKEEPDAACCGMVYVFERANGMPVGDLDDLILASDSMADADVMQVRAFIDQQPDASKVIEKSDLAFVWIWEKRAGSEAGLGAKCIRAALDDIQRRFKRVKTVIFDSRPAQFANWGSRVDPPMVGIEKQAAIESLVSYIQSMNLAFDVRPIFARADDEMNEALSAVGKVWSERLQDGIDEQSDEDDDEYEIDFDRFATEITTILYKAGYEELAQEFEEGVASFDDLTLALKHIIFDSCVHYVRPFFGDQADFHNPREWQTLPLDMVREDLLGIDSFELDLPDWMHVESVHRIDDIVVCGVVASTPIGDLIDYFTLLPKSKPFNVEQFFRALAN